MRFKTASGAHSFAGIPATDEGVLCFGIMCLGTGTGLMGPFRAKGLILNWAPNSLGKGCRALRLPCATQLLYMLRK